MLSTVGEDLPASTSRTGIIMYYANSSYATTIESKFCAICINSNTQLNIWSCKDLSRYWQFEDRKFLQSFLSIKLFTYCCGFAKLFSAIGHGVKFKTEFRKPVVLCHGHKNFLRGCALFLGLFPMNNNPLSSIWLCLLENSPHYCPG